MDAFAVIIIGYIIGFLITIWILHAIISDASRSKLIVRQLRIQNMLLAKMAEKQGMSKEEVNEILAMKF